jgi:hypothetical protein
MLRKLIVISLSLVGLGCVAIPLESTPSRKCGGSDVPCQKRLVLGLFPGIGEAHLNDRATNGKPLSVGLRLADYSLRPLFIAAVNIISLGFPTLTGWLLEPYEEFDSRGGACEMALLGYCKAGKLIPLPQPETKPPDDSAKRSGQETGS